MTSPRRRRVRPWTLSPVLCLLLVGLACSEGDGAPGTVAARTAASPESPRSSPPRRTPRASTGAPLNLLIVMVDTLRADHLATYGYPRPTSAAIDRFAAQGVLFESARSQAPCTFPSVNSLLTSRDPIAFLGQPDNALGIPGSIPSLPEMLAPAGYRSVAVSASAIVRKHPSKHNPSGGFDRGFDVFDESCFTRPAGCVNKRALELLDEHRAGGEAGDRPFFLYLHYLDPHGPYDPPPSYERRFAVGYEGRSFIEQGDPTPIANMIYKDAPPIALSDADLQHFVDLYDDEIGYFDRQFQRLLHELQKRGLADRTLVVLVSDHGEDFLEHGDVKHCRSLHETQIHTPLAMRIPGVAGGRRVVAPVGNLDVIPTLLDYLGIVSEGRFDGRSLRASIEGADGSDAPPIFSSWRSRRSLVKGRYKLHFDLLSRRTQLFDVASDPFERKDLSGDLVDLTSELRALLEQRIELVERDRVHSLEVGESSAEQLRVLGYIE